MKKSKLLSTIMVFLCLTIMFSTPVFASESNGPFKYVLPDGTIVEYYLDAYMNPYNIIDGEFTYLLIPLPHMKITDPDLLAVLQANLPENPESLTYDSNETRAVPTDYFDLTGGSPSYSNEYLGTAILDERLTTTPVFKLNRGHAVMIFKTYDVSAPFGSPSRINLAWSYYDIYRDTWDFILYAAVDCNRFGTKWQHSPSVYPYAQFTFNEYDNMYSTSYSVQTTANW